SLAFVAPQVTVVWPPTGIALTAILLLGTRVSAGIWLGAFLANAMAAEPVLTAIGIATGNTLQAVAGPWPLRQAAVLPSLGPRRDVLALMGFGVLAATTISATVGTASLCIGGVQPCGAPAARIWFVWWLGDAMGALVVAPLLLTWASLRRARLGMPHMLQLLGFLGGVAVLCGLIFAGPIGRLVPRYPFHYALVPVMIAA